MSQVVGALINAVFLVALCFSIFVDAMRRFVEISSFVCIFLLASFVDISYFIFYVFLLTRFVEMEEIKDAKLILIVGSVGLAINLVGA